MKKMKKLFILFSIMALVSAVAFGISLAIFGVGDLGATFTLGGVFSSSANREVYFKDGVTAYTYPIDNMDVFTMDFSSCKVTDLSVSASASRLNLTVSDVAYPKVSYTPAGKRNVSFRAILSADGKLDIKEINAWSINLFGSNNSEGIIDVILPVDVYKNIELNTVSGDSIIKELICDNLVFSSVSGTSSMNIFAESAVISAVSGDLDLKSCNNSQARKLTVSSTSGEQRITYSAAESEFSTISGDMYIYGLTGKVKTNTVSGDIDLDYDTWDNDLDINTVSGDVEIKLPENSGANIDFDGVSGSFSYKLGGESGTLNKGGEKSITGANVHRIDVNTVSGDIDLSEK